MRPQSHNKTMSPFSFRSDKSDVIEVLPKFYPLLKTFRPQLRHEA